MTKEQLTMASTSTLKRKLKSADPDTVKRIWAELNCRGYYKK